MSNFGDLIQEYYVKKFRENDAQRKAEIDSLKSAEDAKKFIVKVRARIAGAYDFPAERCDLKARITKTTEREDFIVENVINVYSKIQPGIVNQILEIIKVGCAGR